MYKVGISLSVLACITASPVHGQQRLPNDAELKSAYCLAAARMTIRDFRAVRELVVASSPVDADELRGVDAMINEAVTRATRLNAYLSPRVSYLDGGALQGAELQGISDFEATGRAFQGCRKSCNLGGPNADKQVACATACMKDAPSPNPSLRCKVIDWLPY